MTILLIKSTHHFGLTAYSFFFLSFRKSSSFELYTQDARAEMIKEQHDGNPIFDHKMWMFKPLR